MGNFKLFINLLNFFQLHSQSMFCSLTSDTFVQNPRTY